MDGSHCIPGTILLPPGHEPHVSAEPMGRKQVPRPSSGAKGVGAQQGRKEPPVGRQPVQGGRPPAAGWTSPLGRRATGQGLSCSLNCLPGRSPGWASAVCPGRAHPWRCGPGGQQAWLVLVALPRCRGARRALGPLRQGQALAGASPDPGALSLSGFPLLVIPWPGSQPCPLGTTPQARCGEERLPQQPGQTEHP